MSVENKIKPLPSGERLDTKTNDDGIMDFLSDDSFVEESYDGVPENFEGMLPSDLNGYGSWATAGDDYDIGYVEEEMERSAGMNYDPQPRRQVAPSRPAQRPLQNPMSHDIMNRRPGDRRNRPIQQQQQPTGFKNSEELYKMFKLFILGPVSLNPGFDFEELLDVLDDMKDMAELVASQKTRKRKLSGSLKRNNFASDFEDEDLEDLDDIDYDF